MRMKIVAALMLVGIMLLSACAKPAASDEEKPIQFRVAWWGTVARHELRHKLYNDILDKYEELHPHVKIIREFDNFNNYWHRLATQAAGGNAPEIITLHTQMYGREYPEKQLIIPLDEFVERGIIRLDGWDPSIIEAGKVDGCLYTIPKGVTAAGMIVNVDMIKEAGMNPPPKSGLTYAEFRDWALKLKERLPEGAYVVNDAGENESIFDTYVRNKGKSLFTPDGKLGFELEDLIEFWSYWSELRELGVVPPAEVSVKYSGEQWEHSMFVNRVTAIEFLNTNQGKILQTYTEDRVDIVRLPFVEGAPYKSGENLIATGFSITRHSDPALRDELARFIDWFVNDPLAVIPYQAEMGVIGSPQAAEVKSRLSPVAALAFEHLDQIADDIPAPEPWAEGGADIREWYQKVYEQLRFGQLDLEQAAALFYEEATRLLDF